MNTPAEQTTEQTPDAPDAPSGQAAGGTARQLSLQARLLTIAALLIAAGVVFWPRGDGSTEAPGGLLVDAGGRPIPVASRMAPVTLVHFWATWCPPCRTEVPSLNSLADDFSEYRGDFTILMVSVADDQTKVEDFVGDRASSVLYDPSWEVTHRYGTRQLPETYLVVRGQVEERWIGAQDWNDPDIREQILEAIRDLRSDEQTAEGERPVGSQRG